MEDTDTKCHPEKDASTKPEEKLSQNGGSHQQQDQRGKHEAPKDGGWGWMIVVASFLVHFLAVSLAQKSFGVLFVEFRRKFDATSQATAWISSLSQFMALSFGPVAGLVSTRLTCKWTVLIGSGLVCLGFILSMFAPNLEYLYFSYGIVIGLGCSFAYSPTVITLGQYFEKRRAMANGLGAAGAGIGSLAGPPLLTYLLDEYSTSGTLLIVAGVMLNLAVAGTLLRPIEAYSTKPPGHVGETISDIHVSAESKEEKGTIKDLQGLENPTFVLTKEQEISTKLGNPTFTPSDDCEMQTNQIQLTDNCGEKEPKSVPVITQTEHKKKKFYWSAIKHPVVLTYGVSCLFLYSGMPALLMFLPSFGISVGLSDQNAALLLTLQGGGDLVGRIIFGILADFNIVPKMYFFVVGGLVAGVSVFVMLVVNGNLVALCVLSFLFGIGGGNIFGLFPVIIAEGLGPKLLQSGFSLATLFLGFPFLFAPAVGGHLEDITGNWNATFYFIGTVILVGSVIPLFSLVLNRGQKNPAADTDTDTKL